MLWKHVERYEETGTDSECVAFNFVEDELGLYGFMAEEFRL